MRFSTLMLDGRPRLAVVDGDAAIDLAGAVPGTPPDLRAALAAGTDLSAAGAAAIASASDVRPVSARSMALDAIGAAAATHGGVLAKSTLLATLFASISGVVSMAARGRPAPSVLDRVRYWGTTPSRSQANRLPVRPRPVCASTPPGPS